MSTQTFSPKIVVSVYSNDIGVAGQTGGWGFDVFVDGKLFVRQSMVPLVEGPKGFETETMARMAGERMAEKIRKGIMPPSLDSTDLVHIGYDL